MDRREFLMATAPLLLGLPAQRREPLAYVTADTEAHLAVVSLSAGRVRRRIATLEGPRSVQSGPGGAVVVGHSAHGAVTLLSGRPLRVRRVLRGFGEPRYAAFAPGGRYAYVSDSRNGELVTIDLERGRVVHRHPVGAGARHLTIDRSGRRIWVALGSAASSIAVVDVSDPLRPRNLRTVRPSFLAHDVGFSPSGRRVWVTGAGTRELAVYAAGGSQPIRRLAADRAPQHVSFAGGRAFVASGTGRSVRMHSLADGRLLRSARVPYGSYNVQAGGGRVLAPSLNLGTLTVLDPSGRPARRIAVAASAHDACLA